MAWGTSRVVVIGGGLSGLTTAYALIRDANRAGKSLRLTLLEEGPRLGGNILTERHDGFVIESGPDSFVVTRPHALKLCEELELRPRLIETLAENRRVYVARHGKLVPMPPGLILGVPSRIRPFLRSPLLSLPGKLRALREMVGGDLGADGGDVSIGDFLERRFGREMVEVILEPLLGGIYAGDAWKLSLRSTFPDWFGKRGGKSLLRAARTARKDATSSEAGSAPGSPFRSLVSGMGELIEKLTEKVGGGAIRLGAKATAIERQGRGFRVVLADGELEADHVVLAIPARAASSLLTSFDASLSQELGHIAYISTATVCFAFERHQVQHPLDAAGFLVPRGEGRTVTAGTFITSKWPGRAPAGFVMVRGFVGGAHDEPSASLPEAELVPRVERDMRDLLGITGEPRFAKVFRYIKASPQPLVGHFERVAAIHSLVEKAPGMHLVGNAYEGVGIPDCVRLAEQAAARIRATWADGQSTAPAVR